MEFKKFSTNTAGFCVTVPEDNGPSVTSVDVQMVDDKGAVDFASNPHGLVFKEHDELKEAVGNYRHADFNGINEVLLHLAICHTVVVDKNKGVYNAASPDELALVDGAKEQGFEFVGREADNVIVVKDSQGYTLRYKVLNVLEFNSTRKRMSIIMMNQQTGYIELYSKGADSIMEKLLKTGDATHDKFIEQTKAYIDNFSKEGLRTLMLTKKDIS